MMCLFIFTGAIIGLAIHSFCRTFSTRLEQDVSQACQSLFQVNLPPLSTLPPLKLGNKYAYAVAFSTIFALCYLSLPLTLAIAISLYLALIYPIAKLDWHYQLIPLELCQGLIILALLSAKWKLFALNINESLANMGIAFMLFWLIYQLAKAYYQQEVFGRGDYWLIAGLTGFIPLAQLAQLICLASCSALLWVCVTHFTIPPKPRSKMASFLAFAPFLCFAGLVTLLLNVLG